MHIKSSSDYRSCQTFHNLALCTIQLHLFLYYSSFTTLLFPSNSHSLISLLAVPKCTILIRSPGTWSKFCAWNPYLWCLCGECSLIFEETDSSGKPLRADIEMYHWDPLGGGRCCPAVGVWSAVSSFRAALSYRIALTEITSSLGSPHLQIKGRPFLSLVRHADGQSSALRFSELYWGPHCSLITFAQYCFLLFPSQIWILIIINLFFPRLERTLLVTLPDSLKQSWLLSFSGSLFFIVLKTKW